MMALEMLPIRVSNVIFFLENRASFFKIIIITSDNMQKCTTFQCWSSFKIGVCN
jgi:hypothetical protein